MTTAQRSGSDRCFNYIGPCRVPRRRGDSPRQPQAVPVDNETHAAFISRELVRPAACSFLELEGVTLWVGGLSPSAAALRCG